ncbi:hypothetical protein DL765_005380 [Monosporascus sp. GIB2]|nr:hypothetical protein DL765_005380 [Monosporascus sp. GIB2]
MSKQPMGRIIFPEPFEKVELAFPYKSTAEGVQLRHIDEEDIAAFASAALLTPDKYAGEEIELSCENLTAREIADTIARVAGCDDIKFRRRAPEETEEFRAREPSQIFLLWASRQDLCLDGRAFQEKYGIHLTTFEEYVRWEKETFLSLIPAGK